MSSTAVFRQGLSLNLGLAAWLDWSKRRGFYLFPRIPSLLHTRAVMPDFMEVRAGIWSQVFVLAQQTLYLFLSSMLLIFRFSHSFWDLRLIIGSVTVSQPQMLQNRCGNQKAWMVNYQPACQCLRVGVWLCVHSLKKSGSFIFWLQAHNFVWLASSEGRRFFWKFYVGSIREKEVTGPCGDPVKLASPDFH